MNKPTRTVRIVASNGVVWDIPADMLELARLRDPGLKIEPRRAVDPQDPDTWECAPTAN